MNGGTSVVNHCQKGNINPLTSREDTHCPMLVQTLIACHCQGGHTDHCTDRAYTIYIPYPCHCQGGHTGHTLPVGGIYSIPATGREITLFIALIRHTLPIGGRCTDNPAFGREGTRPIGGTDAATPSHIHRGHIDVCSDGAYTTIGGTDPVPLQESTVFTALK